MDLEVDGSLANPYAAGAVAVWTTILSAIAILLIRSIRTVGHRIAKGVLFGVVLLITKPTQLLIGNVLYWIADQRTGAEPCSASERKDMGSTDAGVGTRSSTDRPAH